MVPPNQPRSDRRLLEIKEPSWCRICTSTEGPFAFDHETFLFTCPSCGSSWRPEPERTR